MCLRSRVSNKLGARVSSSHPGRLRPGLAGAARLTAGCDAPRTCRCLGADPRGRLGAPARRAPPFRCILVTGSMASAALAQRTLTQTMCKALSFLHCVYLGFAAYQKEDTQAHAPVLVWPSHTARTLLKRSLHGDLRKGMCGCHIQAQASISGVQIITNCFGIRSLITKKLTSKPGRCSDLIKMVGCRSKAILKCSMRLWTAV